MSHIFQQFKTYSFLILLGIFFISSCQTAQAETTHTRFNNENWYLLPHPSVAEFTVHEDGSATGVTENGIMFMQYTIPNPYGIRVQRFEIEDHYHYVVNGEIADSFSEMSALLARAYEAVSAT